MTSKADKNAVAAAPHAAPTQASVLLVQVEALEDDDAIRLELKRQGFRIKQQALVHLTKEDARHFVLQVCADASPSAGAADDTEGGLGDSRASTRDNALASPRSAGSGNDVSISIGRLSGERVLDAINALARCARCCCHRAR